MKGKRKFGIMIMVVILVMIALNLSSNAGVESQAYGHKIPPVKDAFIKLMHSYANTVDTAAIDKVGTVLTDKERAAIGDFLGDDGIKQVKEGLAPDKVKALDKLYPKSGSAVSEDAFLKILPHTLAATDNQIPADKLKTILAGITEEDLASLNFAMGEEGRKVFFTEMTQDRTQVLMDSTKDWVFLDTGKRKYKTIAQYACAFYKQERLKGKLQDVETITLKFREKPLSMYMKWTAGPWTGRELLYNEAIFGVGKVRVRESGLLGIIPVTLPVDSEIAMRGTNHQCIEVGLKYLITMIERDYIRAYPRGDLARKNYGIVDLGGRKVYKFESILSKDPKKGYYCYRIIHYIDYMASLEIKAEIYNFDDQLQESYYYENVKVNPGLPDSEFDPSNPKYSLK